MPCTRPCSPSPLLALAPLAIVSLALAPLKTVKIGEIGKIGVQDRQKRIFYGIKERLTQIPPITNHQINVLVRSCSLPDMIRESLLLRLRIL